MTSIFLLTLMSRSGLSAVLQLCVTNFGYFFYCALFASPTDADLAQEGMTQIVSRMDSQVLSNEQIGAHVRQLAIHSNLASLVERNTPRHWQDRLQQIKKIKDRYGGNSVVSGVATRSASAGSSTSSLAGVAGPSTPAGTSSLSRTSVPTSPPAGHHPASRPWNFTSFV
eukprot:m.379401 g.379401  ORF g.379401 m.379401 type:complete len:169 (-) comp20030_c0_seq4:258-764(-)